MKSPNKSKCHVQKIVTYGQLLNIKSTGIVSANDMNSKIRTHYFFWHIVGRHISWHCTLVECYARVVQPSTLLRLIETIIDITYRV